MAIVSSINQSVVVGTVGSVDPPKVFDSGAKKVRFSVAVPRIPKSDVPDWIPVECWGDTADFVNRYVTPGRIVEVLGAIRMDAWEQGGQSRFSYHVAAESVQLHGGKKDANPGAGGSEPDYEDF